MFNAAAAAAADLCEGSWQTAGGMAAHIYFVVGLTFSHPDDEIQNEKTMFFFKGKHIKGALFFHNIEAITSAVVRLLKMP